NITFTTTGAHTIRIQTREDGLAIDQIVLSPSQFLSASPGALKNDSNVYARAAGTPPAPDTTNPTASISSPASGATIAGSTTVTVTATDDTGVALVELRADGALIGSRSTTPYEFTWDVSSVPNGPHTPGARAVDA